MKVRFALEQDQDGWPSAESEGLWAEPVEGDLYRLDHTPWFACGVAADDVIEAQPDTGRRAPVRRGSEAWGPDRGQVIPRDDGRLGADRQGILDVFEPLGLGGEGMSSPVNMVALDIGPDAPLSSVKSFLATGESDGRWYYEEGCISDGWQLS